MKRKRTRETICVHQQAFKVPFEVLIRRQIARLMDLSFQCARFIDDELVKMNHSSMVNELQWFPILRKLMDEVTGIFLREGLRPAEVMIGHIIKIDMDYIDTSHPNFISGTKTHEMALQKVKSSRIATPNVRQKDGVKLKKITNL